LTGPSTSATQLNVTVSPAILTWDGASQSLVMIAAFGPFGQPLPNLQLRTDIAVAGAVTDFGRLSARNVVTDGSGHATVIYTAPPPPAVAVTGTIVSIQVTPTNSGDAANSSTQSATISLVPPGIIPAPTSGISAKFTVSSSSVTDHQPVLFDASSSTATNATITSYQWNFGDGATGSGISAQHSFDSAGSFVVTLTVTDSVGRSNTASQTISVTSVTLGVPNITVSPTPPVAINQQIFFTSTTTIGSNGRPIGAYTWNFGDGTNASGQNVTHVYTAALTYTVLLTVTDDQGHTSSATVSINVQTSPIADFTITPTAPSAPTGTTASVVFDGSASKTLGGGTIVSYSWKDSLGRTATGPVVTCLFLAPETYTMSLTVTDSAGNTGQVTKSFTVAGT